MSGPALCITVGAGRARAQGRREVLPVECGPVGALAVALRAPAPAVEWWWSPETWERDYRLGKEWRSASGVVVDIDFWNDAGEHFEAPALVASALVAAARGGSLPGNLFHSTPRGARLIAVLDAPVTDGDARDQAADGFAELARRALSDLGMAAINGRGGLVVDSTQDRARFFYGPRAVVCGRARDADLIEMRGAAYGVEALAEAAPPKPEPAARSTASGAAPSSTSDFDAAAKAYNAAHPGDWPKSEGVCPACGHDGCFGRLPESVRWSCFSANHGKDSGRCGVEGGGCWHGDALDLDAHAARLSRAALLRRDGYLVSSLPTSASAAKVEAVTDATETWFRDVAQGAREVVGMAEAREGCTILAVEGLYRLARDRREWTAPISLESPCGGHVPVECLPAWLGEFVWAQSRAMQVPDAFGVALGLSVLGAVGARRVEVEVRPGWIEPANLYVASVLDVGERKSATLRDYLSPIETLQDRVRRDGAAQFQHETAEYDVLEERLKEAKRRAAKSTDGDPGELRRAVEALAGRSRPAPYRLLAADDVTPEAIPLRLVEQRGRLAIFSAEGGIFANVSGRYAEGGANIDALLKAHCGDPILVDRVGRAALSIQRPALTLSLAVQPDVARSLAESPAFRGRGLLARFAYVVPQGMVGRREVGAAPVPPAARNAYVSGVQRLFGIPDVLDPLGGFVPRLVRFAPDAQGAMADFERDLEPRLGPFGDLSALAGWGSKLAGLVARIALLLHLGDRADDPTDARIGEPIDAKTLDRALLLGASLVDHARAAFGCMGVDPLAQDAKHVVAWLVANPQPEVTKRDVYQGVRGRSSLAKATAIDPILELLVQNGYLRDVNPGERRGPGRRPSDRFQVNPLLWSSTPVVGIVGGNG